MCLLADKLAYEHSVLSNKLFININNILFDIFVFVCLERLIQLSLVEKIKELSSEKKITIAELERKTGISNGQIRKWNTSTPGVDKLKLIADYFDVSVDYLLGRTDKKRYYDLTEKDEREIEKELERMIEDLANADSIAFSKDKEEMDDNTRELLIMSLENSLRIAKQEAKKRYTPKKYRGE